MIKMNAKQLRTNAANPDVAKSIKKNPVNIILDNVLDTYNVGAIFRLADAVAATKVYLCGETLTPPNSRIKKASINTWQWVEWEYCKTALEAVQKCKNAGCQIVSVELSEKSISYQDAKYIFPLAIVVGHESNGVSKEVLDASDVIVEMPMWGINVSLNVMVSCGIVLYEIMKHTRKSFQES